MISEKKHEKNNFALGSSGQTLIETLAAIFILVMGVTAAVGLAIYSYNSSGNVVKQIIAIGLAREGIEAVKNMRDTNWLNDTLASDCYDYLADKPTGGYCFHYWLSKKAYYAIEEPPLKKINRLLMMEPYNPVNKDFWLVKDYDPSDYVYGLDFNPDVTSSGFSGFYYHPTAPKSSGTSDFYRQISITAITDPPFDKSLPGPKLKVVSRVWWTDKNCPRHSDWKNDGKCSVQLEMQLTNWKNYQP